MGQFFEKNCTLQTLFRIAQASQLAKIRATLFAAFHRTRLHGAGIAGFFAKPWRLLSAGASASPKKGLAQACDFLHKTAETGRSAQASPSRPPAPAPEPALAASGASSAFFPA
ncbi:MAG: hypothetical protein J5600_01305, partial [Desulfovibrio sp.]|nr:hypothetical protein [Desulfovibrio sp.]